MTDADLVLGYLNPDNYLGGKMVLDPELSHQAIEKKIAKPWGSVWRKQRFASEKSSMRTWARKCSTK